MKNIFLFFVVFSYSNLDSLAGDEKRDPERDLKAIARLNDRHIKVATFCHETKKTIEKAAGGISKPEYMIVLMAKNLIEIARAGQLKKVYDKIRAKENVSYDINRMKYDAFLADENELLAKYIELVNALRDKKLAMKRLLDEFVPKYSENWIVTSEEDKDYQDIKSIGDKKHIVVLAFVDLFKNTEDEKDFPKETREKLESLRIEYMDSKISSQIKALRRPLPKPKKKRK